LGLQVVNDSKENLDMKDKLFGQKDNLQQLLSVDCPQHFPYQCRRAFFISGKNMPDLLDFDFHLFLPILQFRWRDFEIAR